MPIATNFVYKIDSSWDFHFFSDVSGAFVCHISKEMEKGTGMISKESFIFINYNLSHVLLIAMKSILFLLLPSQVARVASKATN